MIKACIFDLDGTLANTLESMARPANRVMEHFGLNTLPTDHFRYYCGNGAEMLVQRCLKDAGDPQLKHLEEACKLYRELFEKDPLYRVQIYPGILETLGELRKKGIRMAVCSNKPHVAAEHVVEQLLPGIFFAVAGQSDQVRKKPAPDGPLRLAVRMEVLPKECLYVGDTAVDMKTGRAAGMHTIGALWGFRDEAELTENGADDLAQCPEDILEILDRMNH